MHNVICLDGAYSCYQYMFQYATLKKTLTKIQKFDLVVTSGVSAILAATLVLDRFTKLGEQEPLQTMRDIFAEEEYLSPWLKPKFKNNNKKHLIDKLFGDIYMSDISVKFVILLMDISGRRTIINSWEHRFSHLRLSCILNACTSHPGNFAPETIGDMGLFFDGIHHTIPIVCYNLAHDQYKEFRMIRIHSQRLFYNPYTGYNCYDWGYITWILLGFFMMREDENDISILMNTLSKKYIDLSIKYHEEPKAYTPYTDDIYPIDPGLDQLINDL